MTPDKAKVIITEHAKQGDRIVYQDKNIWKGLGNRDGLHSYLYTLLEEKWDKSGVRFTNKLQSIMTKDPHAHFTIKQYHKPNRAALVGKWKTIKEIKVDINLK